MNKTNSSIHKICLAAIKQHTADEANPKWTCVYETKGEFITSTEGLELTLDENELPICSTIVDSANWTVLTTQRLITQIDNQLTEGNMSLARLITHGNFKGFGNTKFAKGKIGFPDESEMEYLIETGFPSMIMVYGVKTRIDIEPNDEEDNLTMIKRWTKRGIIK